MAQLLADRPVTGNNFVQRLNKAVQSWKRYANPIMKKNATMLRSYASGYYGKKFTDASGEAESHALNMIDRAVSTWMPFLVGGEPKIIIEPKLNLQLKSFAYTFQQALNQWIHNMKFAVRTLEPAVFNSLFGNGITKSGTKRADNKSIRGYLTVEGRPYCEVVDQVSYVADITAKDREQYEFEGDEYILSTEEAKEQFGKYADKMTADFKLYGEEHPKEIANPDKIKYNELHDYTALIDIFLPKRRTIVTILPPYKGFNKILKEVSYDGPMTGPYDILSYKNFPGTTIPIPPIFSLMELDAAINCLFSKARGQAERIKKIGVGDVGSPEDAKTAQTAKDGNMYLFTNSAGVKELTLGGVVPEIYNFLGFSLGQFSEQAGNLNTAGGRNVMANTLGQEEMLAANSGRMLNMMSQRVHKFASNIAEKLAYEMWQNPTLQIATIKSMPGIAEISVLYNQLQQEGNFTDYELDIDMLSMQKLTPDQKFQKMMQLITAWILPTAQMAAQQGKILNVPEITKDLSTYMDLKTDGWFLSEMPAQTQMNPYQPMGQGGGMKSSDQRFGAQPADNANNALAHQNSKMGETTGE